MLWQMLCRDKIRIAIERVRLPIAFHIAVYIAKNTHF